MFALPSKLYLRCRQSYGNLYSSADFHHREGEGFPEHGNCQIQDQDFHSCYDCVQQCDLGGLADLNTSTQSVQVLPSNASILLLQRARLVIDLSISLQSLLLCSACDRSLESEHSIACSRSHARLACKHLFHFSDGHNIRRVGAGEDSRVPEQASAAWGCRSPGGCSQAPEQLGHGQHTPGKLQSHTEHHHECQQERIMWHDYIPIMRQEFAQAIAVKSLGPSPAAVDICLATADVGYLCGIDSMLVCRR